MPRCQADWGILDLTLDREEIREHLELQTGQVSSSLHDIKIKRGCSWEDVLRMWSQSGMSDREGFHVTKGVTFI